MLPIHANDIVHHTVSCKLIIAKFTRYISVHYLLITSACIYYFGSLEPTLEVLKLSLYCSCLCDTLVSTTTLFQTLSDYIPSSSFLCLSAQTLLISDLNSFLLPASILLSLSGTLLLNGSSSLSLRRKSIAPHYLAPPALQLHLHLIPKPTG